MESINWKREINMASEFFLVLRLSAAILAVLSLGVRIGAAEEPENGPPAAASGEPPQEISLLRDPFWPIGYVPPALRSDPAAVSQSAGLDDGSKNIAGLAEMLQIKGVVRRGNRFYANINGFTVQTGEVVFAISDGTVYKFIVEHIDFQKVQVRPAKK